MRSTAANQGTVMRGNSGSRHRQVFYTSGLGGLVKRGNSATRHRKMRSIAACRGPVKRGNSAKGHREVRYVCSKPRTCDDATVQVGIEG